MATIRTLTPADYRAVAALADDAARRALVGRPLWETEADVAAEVAAAGRGALLVAEADDGSVAGLSGYRLTESGEAEIYGPLVAAEGHGIGAWLEGRVVAMAAQEGATTYTMRIGLANQAGAAWAQWRGYTRDSEAPELVLTWLYPGELKPVRPAAGAVVRPAEARDLERVEALFSECFAREQTQPKRWLDQCWVVETAGPAEPDGPVEAGSRVAGFLRLDKATAWIKYLCVDPGARRQGLGASLLTGVVERFWQEAPRKVGLAVPLDDKAPVSLFRRLGFRREVPVAKWMKR